MAENHKIDGLLPIRPLKGAVNGVFSPKWGKMGVDSTPFSLFAANRKHEHYLKLADF